MKSFDVVSLDLFNTLVYVDRDSFDVWSHMEKALLQFPELKQQIPQIPLSDIITDYYSVVRQKMREKEAEKEFRNDDVLFDVLKQYLEVTPEIRALASEIIKFYFESALPMIHPFPGLTETLEYLKNKGCILVLTSNHSWAQSGWDILHKYDLVNYFERIIFSGDIGWRKPSPKIFSASLSRLSYRSKNHIIHVGDDIEADIKGALKYGIKALWIRSLREKSKERHVKLNGVQGVISEIRELSQVL